MNEQYYLLQRQPAISKLSFVKTTGKSSMIELHAKKLKKRNVLRLKEVLRIKGDVIPTIIKVGMVPKIVHKSNTTQEDEAPISLLDIKGDMVPKIVHKSNTTQEDKAPISLLDIKGDMIPKIVHKSNTTQEDEAPISLLDSKLMNPVIFSSYSLLLISRQKLIGFIKGLTSPLKSIQKFSFDSFPVCLGEDQCLFIVEVSVM